MCNWPYRAKALCNFRELVGRAAERRACKQRGEELAFPRLSTHVAPPVLPFNRGELACWAPRRLGFEHSLNRCALPYLGLPLSAISLSSS